MTTLDEIDHAILEELHRDARASMTAIAEAVHISRAGAHARIKRLTDVGVITGYSVRTDPVRLGHRRGHPHHGGLEPAVLLVQ